MKEIFVKEYGEGIPIVLIHGFCETNYVWQGLANDIKKAYRVICPDLPGFGKSDLPDNNNLSIDDVATMVIDKMDQMGVERAIFIGHSLGGYITLSIARQFPQKVAGFGLFNSSAYADSDEKKTNRNKLIESIHNNGVKPFIRTFVPSLFFHERIEEFEADIKVIKEEGLKLPPETITGYAAAMRDRRDNIDLLKKYPDKALVISGEEDQNVPLNISMKMGDLVDNANFHILPASAHMSMFEQKERSAEIIKDFAKRMYSSHQAV